MKLTKGEKAALLEVLEEYIQFHTQLFEQRKESKYFEPLREIEKKRIRTAKAIRKKARKSYE